MKNAFEMFGTSEEAELDGVWQDYGAYRILLARSGGKNTLYGKTLDEEIKKLGKVTLSAVSPEEADDILLKVFIKACIKDHEIKDASGKWKKGVYSLENGEVKIVPNSPANMQSYLKKLPDLFKELKESADIFSNFQAEVEKETVKK